VVFVAVSTTATRRRGAPATGYSTANGRYLAHRTDFRAVLGEIFRRHFGDSDEVVQQSIPTFSAAARVDPNGFTPLGFLE